jgi:cysteine-S-conjugate beta-lyase
MAMVDDTIYDFDAAPGRRGTGSVKWDLVGPLFGQDDLLPLWVADMDFASPQPVLDALADRARHGVFGYGACMDSYYRAVIGWQRERHGLAVLKDWIVYCPGVVPALNMAVQAFTQPGDGVIIQQPVYYPFMRSITANGRRIINNPLRLTSGRYEMDFDDLGLKAREPGTRLLILCSPHNPVGRVWTRPQLERLAAICSENNITVVSDEIHADLVLPGFVHTPFAALSEECLKASITFSSPSKTFNLAGLHTAYAIIADPEKRKSFSQALVRSGLQWPGVFATVSHEAAYAGGGPWLAQLMRYLQGNLEFLKGFIAGRLPGVKVIEPEATYLVWLDFRGLGLGWRELKNLMQHEARVALDEGYIFGEEGRGFERINIACPRSILQECLERMARAVKRHAGTADTSAGR